MQLLCHPSFQLSTLVVLLHLCLALGLFQSTPTCPVGCTCHASGQVNCVRLALTEFPSDLPPNTDSLLLSFNFIKSVNEDYFQDITGLKELRLDRNQIPYVPDSAFSSLKSLEILDLQYNKIPGLSEHALSGLVNVVELNLRGNRITSLSGGVFTETPALERLNLGENNFKVSGLSAGLLDGSRNLKWLDFGGLGLGTIPRETFKDLGNLIFLNMSGNPGILLDMPTMFSNLQSLETLVMKGCDLHNLEPESFARAFRMCDLQLSSNSLQETLPPASFANNSHLERLALDNNSLTHLHETLFDRLKNLKHVTLANNPWHCGCGLLGLRARWPDHPPIFYHGGLICQSPESLRNRDLWTVTLHEIYTACISEIPQPAVRINDTFTGILPLHCSIPMGYHVAWMTPSSHYITPRAEVNGTYPYRENPTHKLLRNGTLLVEGIQPGTYVCVVTFSNGTVRASSVEVRIIAGDSSTTDPPNTTQGRGAIHVVSVIIVIVTLCIVVLAVWAVRRFYRRHQSRDRLKLLASKKESFLNTRPRAESISDNADVLNYTYDYAYAHLRARIDLASNESAYAVGQLLEERGMNDRPRAPRMRPISRSMHERGPRYYNVRPMLPRTSNTFSGGDCDYITPNQIHACSQSVRFWKKQTWGLTKATRKCPHPVFNGVVPDQGTDRPDSADNRYLEII